MDTKNIDKYVGNRIKQRRLDLGLNMRDIAKKLDISYQQIQKYESGNNRLSAGMLVQFASVLSVDISYFFKGINKATSNNSKKIQSFKYAGLSLHTIEELLVSYAALPKTAQKNIMLMIKHLSLLSNNKESHKSGKVK